MIRGKVIDKVLAAAAEKEVAPGEPFLNSKRKSKIQGIIEGYISKSEQKHEHGKDKKHHHHHHSSKDKEKKRHDHHHHSSKDKK